MNPIAPFQPAARPSRPEPVARDVARDNARTERRTRVHEQDAGGTGRPRRAASTRADFSALLALLAGAGESVRTHAMQQLPPEGASLLDRLLADVESGADVATDPAAIATEAAGTSDALRYGLIPQQPGDDRAANGRTATHALPQDARAAALETLARITERRGASVEQLRALGDEHGADLRAMLDGILARAGTAEGAQLAGLMNGAGTDSALAMATAAAALAHAKAATDVTTPVRDPEALNPEFRSRVERVMARMKQEYGHDVALVETVRTQERQDFLFEQGRTRPGQVVTWTRDSAHTRGEAVDVIVDGQWNNAEGYARLQRIAREEGLRTLGLRDPGHLEMPRDQRQADALAGDAARTAARIEGITLPAAVSGRAPAAPATPAPSGVANVASVAGVAGVARVADTVGTTRAEPTVTSSVTTNAAAYTAVAGARNAQNAGTQNGGSQNGSGQQGGAGTSEQEARRESSHASASARKDAQPDAPAAVLSPSLAPAATATGGAATNAPAVTEARTADRVMELQDRREGTPGSVSRLTLSVDAPDGGSERITVDLRGAQVGTHITTDAASAARMRARTGELQEALGRHGLDADTVRISTGARVDGADAARTPAEREALALGATRQSSQQDASTGNGGRERAPFTRDGQEQPDRQQPHGQQHQSRQDARQDARQAREDAQRAALLQRAMTSHFNGTAR